MITALPQIRHPGPVQNARVQAVACAALPVSLTLRAGRSLADALPEAFAAQGFAQGYVRLDNVACAPLVFVTPAPSPDARHAAWYSHAYHLPSGARILQGGAHLGCRDGAPFVHCHGVWDHPAALPDAGHLICADTILAQDCIVAGWGISGAGLVSRYDPETHFTLFRPEPLVEPPASNAFLISLRPNQDIGTALTCFARENRIESARIEGLGSLIGTTFGDGRHLSSQATEFLILSGQVRDGTALFTIASVGFDGEMLSGRLAPGVNAVCVTAEILLLCGAVSP